MQRSGESGGEGGGRERVRGQEDEGLDGDGEPE